MSKFKVAIVANVVEEPVYECFLATAEVDDQEDSYSYYAMQNTIEQHFQMDYYKLTASLLGLALVKEIELDADIEPKYEDLTNYKLEQLLSEDEDIRQELGLQGKTVVDVTQVEDGLIIMAMDNGYLAKLEEYRARATASSISSTETNQEPREESRLAM
ncbi:hypothetical protein BN59_02742 [Legionella massiliensis]|uniref:Uncharacterized protein n=1 Tax=Legionella massiliensis TaxID=1034943 RepID=A0A078KZM9_9GAMM|nr:hypothetical protein [Legionella massiliensis]CDZ78432.1 hypothetical protein BN59_02742 [Legionella massiliensis]CEE14170.1 hypothetical protein BN1094_02742 [Legionella massiliensis]